MYIQSHTSNCSLELEHHTDLPKASISLSCTVCLCGVSVSRPSGGSTWSPILSPRSQWCPHSLANKWAQSGHPHNGVPPAAGSEEGTSEQLAPRGAADQGRPLQLCRWGQHGKWRVWGGPPPHCWRYLDLMLVWLRKNVQCVEHYGSVFLDNMCVKT